MLVRVTLLPEQIGTRRLVLRLWRREDAPALHAAVNASLEHLRPWMPWIVDEPLTVADREALIGDWDRQWLNGGDAIYGVFAEGTPVGGTGLHQRIGPGGLEIGYWIHVDHAGRGYATELAGALTATALSRPGIDRVEIHHDVANVVSGRIPARLGYTDAGTIERPPVAAAETGTFRVWRMTANHAPGRAGQR